MCTRTVTHLAPPMPPLGGASGSQPLTTCLPVSALALTQVLGLEEPPTTSAAKLAAAPPAALWCRLRITSIERDGSGPTEEDSAAAGLTRHRIRVVCRPITSIQALDQDMRQALLLPPSSSSSLPPLPIAALTALHDARQQHGGGGGGDSSLFFFSATPLSSEQQARVAACEALEAYLSSLVDAIQTMARQTTRRRRRADTTIRIQEEGRGRSAAEGGGGADLLLREEEGPGGGKGGGAVGEAVRLLQSFLAASADEEEDLLPEDLVVQWTVSAPGPSSQPPPGCSFYHAVSAPAVLPLDRRPPVPSSSLQVSTPSTSWPSREDLLRSQRGR